MKASPRKAAAAAANAATAGRPADPATFRRRLAAMLRGVNARPAQLAAWGDADLQAVIDLLRQAAGPFQAELERRWDAAEDADDLESRREALATLES